jgi:hypothetical protein
MLPVPCSGSCPISKKSSLLTAPMEERSMVRTFYWLLVGIWDTSLHPLCMSRRRIRICIKVISLIRIPIKVLILFDVKKLNPDLLVASGYVFGK